MRGGAWAVKARAFTTIWLRAVTQLARERARTMADSDSDEVDVTGAQGFDALRAAPHSRHDCLTHPFDTSDHAAYCPQCYCFVCDIPAGGCTDWASHCHATANAPRWVALRAQAARRRQGEDLAAQRQGQRQRTATADRREDVQRFVHQHVQDPEQEEEEHEEVFAPYKPRYFNHGAEHPDPCVETTSLSFVEPPCPLLPASGAAPVQLPHILATATRRNTLSSLQLEAVMYADLRHGLDLPNGARAGFFLGDGPGVGELPCSCPVSYPISQGEASRGAAARDSP